MKLKIAYCRVSTMKQARDGIGIDTQKRMIAEHALATNLIKSTDELSFFIDDGFSGGDLCRPKMNELLKEIKNGNVEMILAYDLARISRDVQDSNLFLKLILNHGIKLICLYDDAKINTASDRFSTNIKLSNNQFERERTIERTNDGLISIVESGRYPCGGKMTFGWYRDEDKNIQLDKKVYNIIRNAFNYVIEERETSDVSDYLNKSQKKTVYNRI